ncbi:MAG: serine kinase [Pseudomonadota bacterium]
MIIHASAVAFADQGLLILGQSGSGKSGLALKLMALGARLVADDWVKLERSSAGTLRASAPERLAGLIEARFVGLLKVEPLESARIRLAVDLEQAPAARLPQKGHIEFMECEVELISGRDVPNIEAILAVLLRSGSSTQY